MKVIKYKNIKSFFFKKLTKINNNYIKNFKIILENYNKKKKYNIIVCNALSSSHHLIGVYYKNLKNIGWWNNLIDYKKILINKFNIFCISSISTCFGATNHNNKNPFTNNKYNFYFPDISFKQNIKLQKKVINKNKIKKILICIGASIGGIQVLLWSIMYPNLIKFFICIASTRKLSIKNIIYNNINKLSILNNYNWYKNIFFKFKSKNIKGLKLSRIIGHITYLSKNDLLNKSYNKNQRKNFKFKISKYLNYQGNKFIKKFNLNTYLYFLKNLNKTNIKIKNKNIINEYLFISFNKDPRFRKSDSLKIIKNLKNNLISYKNILIKSGHDSFLLKINKYFDLIKNYIKNYIFGVTGFEPMTL